MYTGTRAGRIFRDPGDYDEVRVMAVLRSIASHDVASRRPSDGLPLAERYRLLTTCQVMAFVGVRSRQSVWRYVKQGKLPKPRYLGPRRPVWRLGEVIDHLVEKMR